LKQAPYLHLIVENGVNFKGEMEYMVKYAVGHFLIDETEFEKAWNTMCFWLFKTGYQQSNGNS